MHGREGKGRGEGRECVLGSIGRRVDTLCVGRFGDVMSDDMSSDLTLSPTSLSSPLSRARARVRAE